MRICSNCGLSHDEGASRCRRCGGKKFSLEKRFEPQEEHT